MISKDREDLIRRLEKFIDHLKKGKLNIGDWWIKRIVKIIDKVEKFFEPEQHGNMAEKPVATTVTPQSVATEKSEEWQSHFLFLMIDANLLDKTIKTNQSIQKELLDAMISKSEFGYAYAEGDAEGKEKADKFLYLDDEFIDYARTDEIVLQVSVLAKSDITHPKAENLDIQRAIKPDGEVKVIQIKKYDVLGQRLAGTGFHTIN